MKTPLIPSSPQLFFSKNDKNDLRLGDLVTAKTLEEVSSVSEQSDALYLLGYPDDEGIRINGGRPGAKEAPAKIREFFYKLTPDLYANSNTKIIDLGDLASSDFTLLECHDQAKDITYRLHQLNFPKKIATLGGGHDYAYSDGAGFIESCLAKKKRPIIINFDAHLDVRPDDKGPHSGTPFYRLLNKYKGQFDFIECGIQEHCNSKNHLNWLKLMGGQAFSLEELRNFANQLSISTDSEIFLSIDIDGFSSSIAPGCSQSWASGFSYEDFQSVYRIFLAKKRISAIGIYEVSPPLDFDNHTSKLAALLLHSYLFKGV